MYRCDECKQVISNHTQAHKMVVEIRAKTYQARRRANRFHRTSEYEQIYRKTIPWPDHWTKEGIFTSTDDPGGAGQEIAREITVCSNCKETQDHLERSETPDRPTRKWVPTWGRVENIRTEDRED